MKDTELFATMPELLLVGDNSDIIYDREKFLIDGMQRTTSIGKFLNDDIPELVKINWNLNLTTYLMTKKSKFTMEGEWNIWKMNIK